MCSLGFKPMIFSLLTQCSTIWAPGTLHLMFFSKNFIWHIILKLALKNNQKLFSGWSIGETEHPGRFIVMKQWLNRWRSSELQEMCVCPGAEKRERHCSVCLEISHSSQTFLNVCTTGHLPSFTFSLCLFLRFFGTAAVLVMHAAKTGTSKQC